MEQLIKADIFFFISSIGFGLLFIMLCVVGIYLIRITRRVDRIAKKVERDIATIGDTAKELVLDLEGSSLFSFLFRKKKKSSR